MGEKRYSARQVGTLQKRLKEASVRCVEDKGEAEVKGLALKMRREQNAHLAAALRPRAFRSPWHRR